MKKLTSIIGTLLILTLCFGLGTSAAADTQPSVSVVLDGVELDFDVPPQMLNNRVMVPLRVIFEALGAEVDWNNDTRTVTATRDDLVVSMTIGVNSFQVNGESNSMDVAPVVINNRTLVPARFVSEAFDCKVGWENESRTVFINSGVDFLIIGKWQSLHGSPLYYFSQDYEYDFYADGTVFRSNNDYFDNWFIKDGWNFIIIADDGYSYSFSYRVSDFLLIITDTDDDSAVFVREGSVDLETGDYSELVSPWGYESGDALFFFGYEQEFGFNPDGTAYIYDTEVSGTVIMVGSDLFVIGDEFGSYHWFVYSITGDELQLTDSDMDSAIFARRSAYG